MTPRKMTITEVASALKTAHECTDIAPFTREVTIWCPDCAGQCSACMVKYLSGLVYLRAGRCVRKRLMLMANGSLPKESLYDIIAEHGNDLEDYYGLHAPKGEQEIGHELRDD